MTREQVVKGLECCTTYQGCADCPYSVCEERTVNCGLAVMKDALALLKAQEPRVLTLEEVHGSLKQPIWKEVRSSHKDLYTGWVLAYDIQTGQGITGTRLGMAEPSGRVVWYRLEDYGTKWRCWTPRPDKKRRAETPWE